MSILSHSDVQTIVARSFGSETKLLNYRLEPFSENKYGILGTHLTLFIDLKSEWNNKSELKSVTYFVKTLPEKYVQNFIMDDCIFNEEINFFNKIHPQLLESSKCKKWSPQCYLSKPGALVFEDLRKQNYHVCEGNVLDEKHIKSALTALARFHASSIITEARLGSTFQKLYPGTLNEKIFSNLTKFGKTMPVSFDTISLLAESFGLDSSLVPKIVNRVYQLMMTNSTGYSVICHSDLWKNNLMFDDAVPPNCILIDYQLIKYNTPLTDLAMIIYLNTTAEFRKESEFCLIKHYYSTFRDILDQSEYKLNIPSFDKIMSDYQDYRLIGISYACAYLPSLNMKSYFTEIVTDSVKLEKWCFENRIDGMRLKMDIDSDYKSSVRQLVEEFLVEGERAIGR